VSGIIRRVAPSSPTCTNHYPERIASSSQATVLGCDAPRRSVPLWSKFFAPFRVFRDHVPQSGSPPWASILWDLGPGFTGPHGSSRVTSRVASKKTPIFLRPSRVHGSRAGCPTPPLASLSASSSFSYCLLLSSSPASPEAFANSLASCRSHSTKSDQIRPNPNKSAPARSKGK